MFSGSEIQLSLGQAKTLLSQSITDKINYQKMVIIYFDSDLNIYKNTINLRKCKVFITYQKKQGPTGHKEILEVHD
jgi:hypothetical protein